MSQRRTLIVAALAGLVALIQPAAAQVAIGFGGVAHDSDQPVEAVSDTLTIDQTNGRALFSGNVIIIQGDLRIAAEDVEVIYSDLDGERSVDEVIATGGVLITRGEDAAEGEDAVYSVAAGILTMTGDVLVTQGTTTIAGDSMVVDMTTGDGVVEGRVRTVLTPQSAP
ncbi:lipopolysaccharide transport periplasmic protein LptA [Roseicyclus sp.]|uniref:lipopolysaccharide transport periplasmic protein LptA n=1 Tax=Roseicyclus sp. TaxID=1914329 RepID=UPI001BD132DC|nr:lipopolysaccharide transport periplasmic protein LptA [Roseicyclus sp.]